MPDFVLRGIDGEIADRIKLIARQKNWAINDVILHLLKQSLGMTGDDITGRGMRDIATLTGTWAADENAAFRAALEAFENLPVEAPVLGRPATPAPAPRPVAPTPVARPAAPTPAAKPAAPMPLGKPAAKGR